MARKFKGRRRRGGRRARRKVAKNVKQYVKREIHREVENKFVYYKASSSVLDSTPGLLLAPGIPIREGTSFDDRLGNKIRQKMYELRFQLRNGNPGVVGTQKVRVIAFFDRNSNGVVPNLSQILVDTGSSGLNWLSSLNPNYFPNRYTLLSDRMYDIPQANATAVSYGQHHHIKFFLKNRVMTYSSDNGLITGVVSGCFFVLFVSDTATLSSPPVMDYQSIFTYEDA